MSRRSNGILTSLAITAFSLPTLTLARAEAAVCRMYLTNAARPDVNGETRTQKEERTRDDKVRLGEAAAKINGIPFKDEKVKGPSGDEKEYRSAEIECNPKRARELSTRLHDLFSPQPDEDEPIQFGFEYLEHPPSVKHDALAADFLARRTAKALEALCQDAGSQCHFEGVSLDGINEAVRSHCDTPNSAACAMLQDEIHKQDQSLRDAPTSAGFEFAGSPLEGLLLPEKYLKPLPPPPSPELKDTGVVPKQAVPQQAEPDTSWNRFVNRVSSFGRHARDAASPAYWGPSAPAGVPYTGAGFKDFEPPFRDGPAPDGKAKAIHILSPFGTPRAGHSHQGVDITCKEGEGQPLYAPQAGTVEGWERFGYSGISGNRLWLDHGMIDGVHVETFYAHLYAQGPFAQGIRPGVRVQKGQLIAYCGTTGNAAGFKGDSIHLHYECHVNGPAINPDPACFPSAQKF